MKMRPEILPFAVLVAAIAFLAVVRASPPVWGSGFVAAVALVVAILAVRRRTIVHDGRTNAGGRALVELLLLGVWIISTLQFIRKVFINPVEKPEQLITISAAYGVVTIIFFGTSVTIARVARLITFRRSP